MTMTSEEMIKPSDEILFCYLYFNEIYAFIKYGLPSKFEGLLNKYPKIKTYYGSQWRNNDSYEYAGIATDGKHKGEQMYNKKIGTGLVGLYEYDRGNNYQSYLLKWNLDYQNKGFRAKIQGGAPCKIDVYDVCEQDVFRAISVFFHICKSVSGDENYGKITNALNEALQIMTLKTYVMDTDSLQIIQQAESLFIIILGYFGMNNPSRNINFSQRIDQWCDAACGGKEYAPYYNVKNALNFYRSIRNDSAHGSRLIPGQRDEVTFALYLCILVVYLCLKHKPDVSVCLDPECNIQCRINGEVKLGDKIIQGKGNDEYDLEPFAEYTVNGHSFKLDWECYGATVNDKGDITHKEYQIGQFPSEAIGAFLAEKLKGADNAVIQNMISLLNEQTDKLSTDIVELQTGLKNELSRLADCKDNINEKVEEVVNRFNEQQNQLLGKLDKIEIGIRDIAARVDNTSQKVDEAKESLSAGNEKIQKTLDEIGAEKKKAKEERIEKEKVRKKRTQIIVGSVAFIALLSAGYYLWDFLYNTADGAFAREDYQLAYEKGHPDAA